MTDILTSSNMNFDEEYYPSAIEVKMLTENEWPVSDQPKPKWLGFIHDNKPYKLEEIPTTSRLTKLKVEAPYLERAFLLSKCRSGRETKEVIHATVERNIDSILTNNFNWRLSGSGWRGWRSMLIDGIYFTTSKHMDFAAIFTDQSCPIFIETEIIYENAEIRTEYDNCLPDSSYDSIRTEREKVIVKFEDSVTLPLCVCMQQPSGIPLGPSPNTRLFGNLFPKVTLKRSRPTSGSEAVTIGLQNNAEEQQVSEQRASKISRLDGEPEDVPAVQYVPDQSDNV